MNSEELLKRIGIALIAAGHALVGTQKNAAAPANLQQPIATTTAEEPPTEEKPKRKRRTKAEIEAEKKAKEEAEAAAQTEEVSEDDFGGSTEGAEVEITEDDLKKALVACAKKFDKAKAFGILGKFGAKKVADLKKEQYAEVLEAIESES